MLKRLIALGLFSAAIGTMTLAPQAAQAEGCTCNPCTCEAPCPCK